MRSSGGPLISRRRVVGALLSFAGVLLEPVRAIARACRLTVSADEGPFYPVEPIPFADDLVTGFPDSPGVRGRILYLLGRVVDGDCKGVPGATVEIWQCDGGGQYKHPRAPKNKELDAGFKYFAKVRAGEDGSFRFRTLHPSPYKAFGIDRAPHIHIRVKGSGFSTTTTEMYFASPEDESLRAGDRVFQGRGARKGEMIVQLKPASELSARLGRRPEPDAYACEYDLSLSV